MYEYILFAYSYTNIDPPPRKRAWDLGFRGLGGEGEGTTAVCRWTLAPTAPKTCRVVLLRLFGKVAKGFTQSRHGDSKPTFDPSSGRGDSGCTGLVACLGATGPRP